jgi:hypothetical protein
MTKPERPDDRGRWEEIQPIILEELVSQGIEVTVYDLG